jgi:hypothetical protein
MLTNIIPNPMGASISSGVPRKTPNFIHGPKAPHEFVRGVQSNLCDIVIFYENIGHAKYAIDDYVAFSANIM